MLSQNIFLQVVAMAMMTVNILLFMASFGSKAIDEVVAVGDDHSTLFIIRIMFVLNAFACLPGAFS